MTATDSWPKISLLWPPDAPAASHFSACDAWAVADLDLDRLVDAISIHTRYRDTIRVTLYTLCDEPEIITYRQEIVDDLLRLPALVHVFEQILPRLHEIGYLGGAYRKSETPLHQTIWRLSELEVYGDCVQDLQHALEEAGPSLGSRGLRALRDALRQVTADESFRSLMQQLPEMCSQLRGLRSITIGINLDHLLRPAAATLLSVSPETFSERSFLSKLLGQQSDLQGIGPLHTVDTAGFPGARDHPLMQPLFRDLDKIIKDVVRPVADFLARYVHVSSQFLLQLEREIAFYLGGVRLIGRVGQQGLTMCRPRSAQPDERICEIEGFYSVNLALRMQDGHGSEGSSQRMVLNDVRFGDRGRIFILTGPNRGGKTTFAQAVGLAHVLYQAGLYVPGTRARMSPVDAIYTHFPCAEEFSLGTGRLGEEARRLRAIFDGATCHSLILLNESLSTTSPGECLYLARDIVRALRYLGARAIYATHLHELATNLEEINEQVEGHSRVMSLVATVEAHPRTDVAAQDANDDDSIGTRRTYKIEPGPPMGLSYAREIAAQYGISFEKLIATVKRRATDGEAEGSFIVT